MIEDMETVDLNHNIPIEVTDVTGLVNQHEAIGVRRMEPGVTTPFFSTP